MRYDWSKSGCITGTLWERRTKTAKKDYFISNPSPLFFFKQSCSNFQEMFLTLYKKKRYVGLSKK